MAHSENDVKYDQRRGQVEPYRGRRVGRRLERLEDDELRVEAADQQSQEDFDPFDRGGGGAAAASIAGLLLPPGVQPTATTDGGHCCDWGRLTVLGDRGVNVRVAATTAARVVAQLVFIARILAGGSRLSFVPAGAVDHLTLTLEKLMHGASTGFISVAFVETWINSKFPNANTGLKKHANVAQK